MGIWLSLNYFATHRLITVFPRAYSVAESSARWKQVTSVHLTNIFIDISSVGIVHVILQRKNRIRKLNRYNSLFYYFNAIMNQLNLFQIFRSNFIEPHFYLGARGSAVGWGIAIQVGRGKVEGIRIDSRSSHWKYPSDCTQPITVAGDKFTTFISRLSWKLGTSTSCPGIALPYWPFLFAYVVSLTHIILY
jgi:hypothetical protein